MHFEISKKTVGDLNRCARRLDLSKPPLNDGKGQERSYGSHERQERRHARSRGSRDDRRHAQGSPRPSTTPAAPKLTPPLPVSQKKFYRQRAHANPLSIHQLA